MKIRQDEPDPWDPTCVPTFWINHASRFVMRGFEERLRPIGFGMAYLQVAIALKKHGALQQKDLLKFIRVEQPTMAALLKRMERDRLIVRKPDPNDRRAQLIALTARAKTTLERARTAMAEVVEQAVAGVSKSDREVMVRTLKVVVENLSARTVLLSRASAT